MANKKTNYDRKRCPRKLRPGDKVLILLPTDANKLLMQWKGPFQVIERINDVDYVIEVSGKNNIFHINMLKKYEEREPTQTIVRLPEESHKSNCKASRGFQPQRSPPRKPGRIVGASDMVGCRPEC